MAMNKYAKTAMRKYPAIRKRARVYVPAVRQLASDVMYLKGLINSEPKYHLVATSNNFNYAGTVVSLCDIPEGDGEANRDGNRVLPRYFTVNVHINKAIDAGYLGGTTTNHTTVRMIIFRWWGEAVGGAGATPTASEILGIVSDQYAPLRHLSSKITGSKGDRSRRIEVHRNELFTLDQRSITSKDFSYNITLNGGNKPKEHMEFGTSATNPPTDGGFFILFISDVLGTDVSYYLSSKVVFYDN